MEHLKIFVIFAGIALAASASFAQPCPSFGPVQQVGTVAAPALTEASGLMISRDNPGVLWSHNDSPDIVRIFALSEAGTQLADFTLAGAAQVDWEDITLEPQAGQDLLYIGDIGDNEAVRASIIVYRVAEPFVDVMTTTGTASLAGVTAMTLTYPDGPRDAETLMSDPRTGDLYIVEKKLATNVGLYRKPAPHVAGSSVLERVATISPGLFVAGGDISPSGDAILLRAFGTAVNFWRRPSAGNLWDAFLVAACPITLNGEVQGEAICFSTAGCGFFTLGEGVGQPIHYMSILNFCAVSPNHWLNYD